MQRYIRLIAVALFLALLFAAFELSSLRQHFTLSFIQEQLMAHPVGGLILFTLLFSLGNLAQIPGWIFLAAAVLALGQVMGGMATYAAACTSCLLTFLLVRLIGGDALRKLDSPIAQRILARLDSRPVQSVFLLRTLFQTAPPLNYTLALSGVPLRSYLIGTLLGLPLPIMLYCLFFDTLSSILGIK